MKSVKTCVCKADTVCKHIAKIVGNDEDYISNKYDKLLEYT